MIALAVSLFDESFRRRNWTFAGSDEGGHRAAGAAPVAPLSSALPRGLHRMRAPKKKGRYSIHDGRDKEITLAESAEGGCG